MEIYAKCKYWKKRLEVTTFKLESDRKNITKVFNEKKLVRVKRLRGNTQHMPQKAIKFS